MLLFPLSLCSKWVVFLPLSSFLCQPCLTVGYPVNGLPSIFNEVSDSSPTVIDLQPFQPFTASSSTSEVSPPQTSHIPVSLSPGEDGQTVHCQQERQARVHCFQLLFTVFDLLFRSLPWNHILCILLAVACMLQVGTVRFVLLLDVLYSHGDIVLVFSWSMTRSVGATKHPTLWWQQRFLAFHPYPLRSCGTPHFDRGCTQHKPLQRYTLHPYPLCTH